MLKVVSVSLGSSERDHQVQARFLGQELDISRVGTDGDFKKAQAMLRDLDGKVDAIGLGGVDVYLYSKNGRYVLRDGQRLLDCVEKTPVADGSGLKNTLERHCIDYLVQNDICPIQGQKVLMVSGMDRFGMAESLEEAGAHNIYGDLIFALGIDKPISSLDELAKQADKLLPEIAKLPISMIYPIGKKQSENKPDSLTTPYFEGADIIAGDFHFIRQKMPLDLSGKSIITNTTTARDMKELAERGVQLVVTTTPSLEGRSFGTNVLQAVMLALLGKKEEECQEQDYLDIIKQAHIEPNINRLGVSQSV